MFFTTVIAIAICIIQISVLTSQLKKYNNVIDQLQGASSVGYQASQAGLAVLDCVFLASKSQDLV